MSTKYLLFQKHSFSFFTKKETKHFVFSNFIEKKNASFSILEIYKNHLSLIIEKFIEKADLQKKDNIIILFDHPWVKIIPLTMPWFSNQKIKKIIPFEIQKKYWIDNVSLQQDFYILPDKKNQKKRIITYGIEKQLLNIISSLFMRKELNLYSIVPYIHWIEQKVYTNFILKKRKEKTSLVLSFHTTYAVCFFYDFLGLKAVYTLPINNQKVDKKFWIVVNSLLKRIFLLQSINTKIFIENKKIYTLLSAKNYPCFEIKNEIDYFSLRKQNKKLQTQKKELEFYKEKFYWDIKQIVANKKFLKKKFKKLEYVIKYSFFFRYFLYLRFFIFLTSIFIFLSIIFILGYQGKNQQRQKFFTEYQGYLKSYLLKSNLDQELVQEALERKNDEFKKIQKDQEKFYIKNYEVSKFLSQIIKLKPSIKELEITQIDITLPTAKIVFKGEKKRFKHLEPLFSKYFSIVSNSIVDNNTIVIQLKQK